MREFHVRRTARERYLIDPALLGVRGDLMFADIAAIRRLAARMNDDRAPGAPSVGAGEIGALGVIHEIGHLLIERLGATDGRPAMATALRDIRERLGDDADSVLDAFAAAFPVPGPGPEPAEHRLEELLLTRVANENPALGPLRELVDDRVLVEGSRYADVIAGLEASFGRGAQVDVPGAGRMSLIELMRAEKLDFMQVNYSMAERSVEQRLLAVAAETGTAILVNLPFARARLFRAVSGKPVPDWTKEFDASTWGQFFLKYILANEAVNCVLPGTDKPEYMVDNLNAGRGRLPDAATRKRMVQFIDSLG